MAFSLISDRFHARTSRPADGGDFKGAGRRRRRTFWAAVAVLVSGTLALGGCSLRLEREPGALPPLTHRAQLREELFGLERAIEAGAAGLAQAAGAAVPAPSEAGAGSAADTQGSAADTQGSAADTQGSAADTQGSSPAGQAATPVATTGTESDASNAATGASNDSGSPSDQYPLASPTEAVTAGNVTGEDMVALVLRSRIRQSALGGPWLPWSQAPAPESTSSVTPRTIPANPAQLQELVEQALLVANELALLTEDSGQATTAITLTISYAQELSALSARTGRRSDSSLLAAAPTSAKQHLVGLRSAPEGDETTPSAEESAAASSAAPVAGEETAAQLSIGALLAINYVKWAAETAAIASEPEERAQFTRIADRIGSWLLAAQPIDTPGVQGEQADPEGDMSTFSVDRSASPRQWVESALAQAVPMLMQEAIASPAGDAHSPLRAVRRQAALMYAAQLAAMQVEWGATPSALPGQ